MPPKPGFLKKPKDAPELPPLPDKPDMALARKRVRQTLSTVTGRMVGLGWTGSVSVSGSVLGVGITVRVAVGGEFEAPPESETVDSAAAGSGSGAADDDESGPAAKIKDGIDRLFENIDEMRKELTGGLAMSCTVEASVEWEVYGTGLSVSVEVETGSG